MQHLVIFMHPHSPLARNIYWQNEENLRSMVIGELFEFRIRNHMPQMNWHRHTTLDTKLPSSTNSNITEVLLQVLDVIINSSLSMWCYMGAWPSNNPVDYGLPCRSGFLKDLSFFVTSAFTHFIAYRLKFCPSINPHCDKAKTSFWTFFLFQNHAKVSPNTPASPPLNGLKNKMMALEWPSQRLDSKQIEMLWYGLTTAVQCSETLQYDQVGANTFSQHCMIPLALWQWHIHSMTGVDNGWKDVWMNGYVRWWMFPL